MTGFSLKDELFNRDKVSYLASRFVAADSEFDEKGFIRDVMKKLKQLELKQRIVLIAQTLEKYLSDDFKTATDQICKALPPRLDPSKTDDDFGDFIIAPLGEFVVRNGLSKSHLKRSLSTLKEITQRFSMEDAIRYFIREFPEQTLRELEKWSANKNYHVRRLVSEGTRPSLPWSGRIGLEFKTTMPLLNTLHADPTRYVTRSVANHLNDIAKSEPDLVITTLKDWKKLGKQSPDELAWMTRHALRTLVKQGNPKALKLLGYRSKPEIEVSQIELERQSIRPGETLQFEFVISANRTEALMIDYVIDFVKANGKRAPKVFKAKQLKMRKGESQTVSKRHPLRANATTFKLYPGTHNLSVQINGQVYSACEFELQD